MYTVRICASVVGRTCRAEGKRHQLGPRVPPPIRIGLPFNAAKLSLPWPGCASSTDGFLFGTSPRSRRMADFCCTNSIARPPPRSKSSRPARHELHLGFTCGPALADRHFQSAFGIEPGGEPPGSSRRIPPRPPSRGPKPYRILRSSPRVGAEKRRTRGGAANRRNGGVSISRCGPAIPATTGGHSIRGEWPWQNRG